MGPSCCRLGVVSFEPVNNELSSPHELDTRTLVAYSRSRHRYSYSAFTILLGACWKLHDARRAFRSQSELLAETLHRGELVEGVGATLAACPKQSPRECRHLHRNDSHHSAGRLWACVEKTDRTQCPFLVHARDPNAPGHRLCDSAVHRLLQDQSREYFVRPDFGRHDLHGAVRANHAFGLYEGIALRAGRGGTRRWGRSFPRVPLRRSSDHASWSGNRWDFQLPDALGRPTFCIEPYH